MVLWERRGLYRTQGMKFLESFGGRTKGVVALAKGRMSEEDRGLWIGVRGRNHR